MREETLQNLIDEYDSVRKPSEALMFAAALAEAASQEAQEAGEVVRSGDLACASTILDSLRREVETMENRN